MRNTIEFRLARKCDVPQIAVLSKNLVEVGLGWSWTPERVKRSLMHRETNVLVACEQDIIAGFGIMQYGELEANLNLLAVRPDYRNMGIGKHLVHWLEKSAITTGIDVIFLQCRINNSNALRFYEKLGYRKLRVLPQYYAVNEAAVLLGHDLMVPQLNLYLHKPE